MQGNQPPADRDAALKANIDGYDATDDPAYIRGAPHVRHAALRSLLGQLAADAIGDRRSILDLGGGSGLSSFAWLGRGLDVTVVDSSAAMLRRYRERDPSATVIVADLADWLGQNARQYDVVILVSVLHHIPDYLSLLEACASLVAPGGSLLTFQDPLLYTRQSRVSRLAAQAAYYSWRLFQGRRRQGILTLSRRIRGRLSPNVPADFEEYHVVRNGVDEEAVARTLRARFPYVRVTAYWSTQGPLQQWLGTRIGLTSSFAVLATCSPLNMTT